MAEEGAAKGEGSGLERVLSIVTEVRPGEGTSALLMTLNIFFLLTAYYVIKPVREGLILAMDSGAEYKAYMSGAIAIALLVAVPTYASFAKRVKRNRLVVGVTLFFVSHLLVFFVLSKIEAVQRSMGLIFYLWVGIFNMMVVAQFWAFANDIYDEEQGKRLFALIGVGQTAGAALGAGAASVLIPVVGVYQMLLVCGALLVGCAFLTQVVHLRESRQDSDADAGAEDDRGTPGTVVKKQLKNTVRADAAEVRKAIEAARAKGDLGGDDGRSAEEVEPKQADPTASSGSFSMVLRYRYLILMAVFSLLFTFVNSNGEFILGDIVSGQANAMVDAGELVAAEKKDWIGGWFGGFFFWVNILTLLFQSFLVSRVVKLGGVKLALFIYPLLAMLDAAAIAIVPVLLVARLGKTLENSSDYSFNNTARQMLWLPTTKPMKYQAKQAVDTFFVRMGDVSSAILVAVLAGAMSLGARYFAIANLILAAATAVVVGTILREQKHIKAMRDRGELPGADAA